MLGRTRSDGAFLRSEWDAMVIHAELARCRLGTFNLLCARAAERAAADPPYQHAIIDECQVSVIS